MTRPARLSVSVVVPAYNAAPYIGEAITSVLCQTEPDLECIVVDDGSTDDTVAVVKAFTDPRIRLIRQPNQGLAGARNVAIRAALGEFVALLDADDRWEPTFLTATLETMRTRPEAGATYCGFAYMDGRGHPTGVVRHRIVPPDAVHRELLLGNWMSACAVVVRRAWYAKAGGFDTDLRACEDTDMWLRLSKLGCRFVGTDAVLVWYRRTGTSMSDDPDRMAKARLRVLEKHLGSLRDPACTWGDLKLAAVARMHSSRAQDYLAQGRVAECAESMRWLVEHAPGAALSLDLWYSLACAHQLVGRRGDFQTWCASQGESDVRYLLDQLRDSGVTAKRLGAIGGQAYLSLALLNYGVGDLAASSRALLLSVGNWPRIIGTRKMRGLLVRIVWRALVPRRPRGRT